MDPITNKIIEFFQNNQPRPTTATDIAQAIGESFESTTAVLGNLLTQGYIYRAGDPTSNFYWYPTKYITEFGKKRTTKNWAPTTEYAGHQEKLKGLTPENRDVNFEKIQKELDQYYPFFTQNHPEYKKLFQWLDRNVAHKKELLKDAAALFLKMDVKHNAIAYPNEKKYKIPDYLVSVENAMYETMGRFINNMPDKRKEVLTQDEYYTSYNKVSQLTAKIQQKFINEVVKTTPKGSVIPDDTISKFIEKDLAKIISDKKHTDMFLGMVSSKLSADAVDPKTYKVFFNSTPLQTIVGVLAESLMTPEGIVYVNTFKKTCQDEKTITRVYSALFSNTDLSGYTLAGLDLSVSFTLEASVFKGTDFNNTDWTGATVQHCDFTNAKITHSVFQPKVFQNNIIKNLDLLDSVVNKKIKWDENPGTPLNLFIRDVDYDKDKLEDVVKSETFRFTSVPLAEGELDDAKTIALFLKKFLEGKDTFSSASLQLYKLAALNADIVTQLKNWLSDENPQVPNFMPVEQLKDWMIENSKNGELAKAGFGPKEVSILFKRSREVVSPQAQRLSPEEQKKQERDKKINQVLTQYQGQKELPAEALISLLSFKDGNLYPWFLSFKKDIKDIDLHKIYYALVSSLREYHVNPYIKPVRRYEAFPHATYLHSLDPGKGDFQWSGTHQEHLFAIVLNPDFSLMPPDIAKSTKQVTTYGTKHLQNAVAYSRIMPLSYTLTSVKGKPQVRYVWFLVEMQSDAFQHALKGEWKQYEAMYSGKEPKRSKKELVKEINEKFKDDEKKEKYKNNLAAYEAATEFRSYFKHWPENLLNSIIATAVENGVDEIWMPKGDDVFKNVGPPNPVDWTYNYDRPAKVFGGKLKDVGVQVLMDPGFDKYTKKTSNVYVIEIPKGGGLKLNWQENPAVTEDGYFKSRKKHAISPLPEWQKYFDFYDDLMHGTKEGNTIGGFLDMSFPELNGKEELVKEIYEAWLNATTIDRASSLKLNWAIAAEDTAEAIVERTQQAYSFERYQMPYWLRLTQHLLDLGFTPEETEQVLWTREARVLADSANLDNREDFQRPEQREINFEQLLGLVSSDKHRIIGRMRESIDQCFKSGDATNFYTAKRLKDSGFLTDASLKLNWDSTNSFLDTVYWKSFIRVFIANYVQKRIELGEPNREMLISEAVKAVLKEIPSEVTENYEFNALLLDTVDELKNEYGQSFEDLMVSENSLKLDWTNHIQMAENILIKFKEELLKYLKDFGEGGLREYWKNAEFMETLEGRISEEEFDTLGTLTSFDFVKIVKEFKNPSLKLNWNPGDPETPTEKKKRLLTIVKHPEYYSYTTSGGTWQMNEYEKALEELKDEFGINVSEPDHLSKEDALSIHHPEHVENVYKIPNKNNPGWAGGPWDASAQKAVLRSAGGMVKANQEALNNGIAVQMYDAFHHAYPDHGEGFCVLNDIAIAAKKISSQGKKVMIVDTDVHQGQGTAVCTKEDPNIYTVSTHAEGLYPYYKEESSLDKELKSGITDVEYLRILEFALNEAFSEFQPDLVMYVAGTDLYGQDKLSNTKITLEGIQKRDQLVFKFFGEKGIPVSTSIPQGYAHDPNDSRTMIKNTLREANKALSYYDKDNSLKLDWADVEDVDSRINVGDYVCIYSKELLGRVVKIGDWYDVKYYDDGDLMRQDVVEGGVDPGELMAAVKIENPSIGQTNCVCLLQGLKKFKPSLRLDWNIEHDVFKVGDKVRLLKNITTTQGFYPEGMTGIIEETTGDNERLLVDFERGYVYVFHGELEKVN